MSVLKKIIKNINSVNNNKYFAGIAMLILNICTKYITIELSETQEDLLKHVIVRRFGLFTIFWIGTKDIITSFILTTCFIIFVSNIFNENSSYCIFKKKSNKNIKQSEYKKCKNIVYEYESKNLKI